MMFYAMSVDNCFNSSSAQIDRRETQYRSLWDAILKGIFCAESPPIMIYCILSVKYDAVRSKDFSDTPKELSKRWRRIEWSAVSNAAVKSRNISMAT